MGNESSSSRRKTGAASSTDVVNLERCGLGVFPLALLAEKRVQLSDVEQLLLRFNAIRELPASVSALSRLRVLDVTDNELSLVSPSVGALSALIELRLDRNQLALLPALAGLASLTSLDVSHNRLAELPLLPLSLVALRVSDNQLTVWPETLGACAALRVLNLASNRISAFPTDLQRYSALETLDVSANAIPTVPSLIGMLQQLESLSLAGNGISSLPLEIGLLSSLTDLNLSSNALVELPDAFIGLHSLRRLWASGNAFTEVPKQIESFQLWVCDLLSPLLLATDDATAPAAPADMMQLTKSAGGLATLLGLLRDLLAAGAAAQGEAGGAIPDGDGRIAECLFCVSASLSIPGNMDAVAATSDLRRAGLTLAHAVRVPSSSARRSALILLAKLAKHSQAGHAFVCDAFAGDLSGCAPLPQFSILVDHVLLGADVRAQALGMRLVNVLVSEPTVLNSRCELRARFQAVGLNTAMAFLKAVDAADVSAQVLEYEDERNGDENELLFVDRSTSYYYSSSDSSDSGSGSSSQFLSFSSDTREPSRKGSAPAAAPAAATAVPARPQAVSSSDVGRLAVPPPAADVAFTKAELRQLKRMSTAVPPPAAAPGVSGAAPAVTADPSESPSATLIARRGTVNTRGGASGGALPATAATAPVDASSIELVLHLRMLGQLAAIGESTLVRVALTPGATAGAVIREVVDLYPGFDSRMPLVQYGLVVATWEAFAAAPPDSLPPLSHSANVADAVCLARGSAPPGAAMLLHLLLRPWRLNIVCEAHPQLSGPRDVSPALSCREIVRRLIDGLEGARTEHLSLVLRVPSEGVEIHLRHEELLKDYPQVLTLAQVGALHLVPRPMVGRVLIGGQVQTIEAQASQRVADLAARIASLYCVANPEDYGLLLLFRGWADGEGLWLDPEAPLAPYTRAFSEQMLAFRLRPIAVTVRYLARQEKVELSLVAPVGELLPELCTLLAVGPTAADEILLLLSEGAAARPLDDGASLQSRGVRAGATLILKKRGDGNIPLARSAYTSIWDEGPGSIVLDPATGRVTAGTVNRLVETLTNIERVDVRFMDVFLFQYRWFCSAPVLLAKLEERYAVPRNAALTEREFVGSIQKPLQLVVVSVVREWVCNHLDVDEVPQLLVPLEAFAARVHADGHVSAAARLRELIETRRRGPGRPEEVDSAGAPGTAAADGAPTATLGGEQCRIGVGASLSPAVPLALGVAELSSGESALLDVNETELALQITLRDFAVYAQIDPREMLDQAWTRPRLFARCPHLLAFIERFNQLANWVSFSVLAQRALRDRARTLTTFIKIGEAMRELGNFSGVMAVIVGLNNAAVSRLKFTKLRLPRRFVKLLTSLEDIMTMVGSFKAYRAELAARRGGHYALPYIGVFLTDLVFIEDGNPSVLPASDGVVLHNFEKREQIFGNIETALWWRRTPYPQVAAPAVWDWLTAQMRVPVSEDELFRMSLEREPRGADRAAIA